MQKGRKFMGGNAGKCRLKQRVTDGGKFCGMAKSLNSGVPEPLALDRHLGRLLPRRPTSSTSAGGLKIRRTQKITTG